MQRFTPTIEALVTPDVDRSLDDQAGEDGVLERVQGARPVVGGAAAVLTIGRQRAIWLVGLVVTLAAFGAVAPQLPELPEDGAVAVAALIVLPAFLATIWLALPLARVRDTWLLAVAALAGVAWVVFYFGGLGIAANTSKLVCFILVGFWFLSLFEALWWLTLVAILVPWVDIWSVSAGPTRYVTEEKPGFFEDVSVALHVPGETATANIGPPDIVFFALFLAAAQRFNLRIGLTWLGDDRVPVANARPRPLLRHERPPRPPRGLPRVPPPERGPHVAQRARGLGARGPARPQRRRSETDSTCGVCGNMSTGRQRSSS